MKGVAIRALTGIILLAIIGLVIFGSRMSLLALVLVISCISIVELFMALRRDEPKYIIALTLLTNILIQWFAYEQRTEHMLALIGLFLLMNFVIYTFQKSFNLNDLFIALVGVIYVSVLFSFLLLLPAGNPLVLLLVFIAAWGTDTFAFIWGMLLGKTPLAPTISPKKTVEGAVGGTISALVLAYILQASQYFSYNVVAMLVAVFFGSLMSQLGDLFASRLKREVGVKDFGWVLLGHGGILDRFDSILFAAPTIWFVLRLFSGMSA